MRSTPSATIVNTASLTAAASRSRTASRTRVSLALRAWTNDRADLIVWSATSPEISRTRWKKRRETCGLNVDWEVDSGGRMSVKRSPKKVGHCSR